MQRECEIKAAATIAKTKPAAQFKASAKAVTTDVSERSSVATRTPPSVQPDSSIVRPPWAFLQLLMALA